MKKALTTIAQQKEPTNYNDFPQFQSILRDCIEILTEPKNKEEIAKKSEVQAAIKIFVNYLAELEKNIGPAVEQSRKNTNVGELYTILRNNDIDKTQIQVTNYSNSINTVTDPYAFFIDFRNKKIQIAKQIRSLITEDINFRLYHPCSGNVWNKKILIHLLYHIHKTEELINQWIYEYIRHPNIINHLYINNEASELIKKQAKHNQDIQNLLGKIGLFSRFNAYKTLSIEKVEKFEEEHKNYCKKHGTGPQINYSFDTEAQWLIGRNGEESNLK